MKLKPRRPDVITDSSPMAATAGPPGRYWPGVFLGSRPSGPLCAGAEQAVLPSDGK